MVPRGNDRPGRPFPWAMLGLLLLPIALALLFLPGLGRRAPDEPPAPSAQALARRSPGETRRRLPQAESGPQPQASASGSASPLASAELPVPLGLAEHTLVGKTLWEKRVIRAQRTLEQYLESARYPFSSQPIGRHLDQATPNFVAAVTLPLGKKGPGQTTDAKVTLNQDRSTMQGDETVTLRVHCENGEGPQPCVFLQPPVAAPRKDMRGAEKVTPAAVPFAPENDDPSDMVGRFTPAKQGFSSYEGPVIIEGQLKIGSEEGSPSWQVFYTPAAPAVFTRKIRESLEQGSLSIYVGLQVDKPGRYVVTARAAQKSGKLFAFLQFNEELPRGITEARLQIFGKLVHDEQAESPFVVRDVEGFLLRDGGYPDRELMAMMPGDVYTTRAYPPAVFSQDEWQSEEKQRHVDHFKEELKNAEDELEKEKHSGQAGQAGQGAQGP